jgi:catechol-2,3-dioxygenase
LHLATARLAAQRAWYTETLGLPLVAETATSFTLRAGASRLTFAAGDPDAHYHVAFNLPRIMFPQAKAFLAARVPLLVKDGQDHFPAADWKADRVYVADPAGNLVEFIARQTWPDDATGAFTPDMVRSVSEVALPVDDVPATVAALTARLGIASYGAPSEQFAALGDDRGLLIIVRVGRPYVPTGTPAVVAPLAVTLRGARNDAFALPGFPYQIAVTTA